MAIRDFFPRSGDIANDPISLEAWLDKLGLRQNIGLLNPLNAPASGDQIGVLDVSTGQYLSMTLAVLLAMQLNGLLDISGASGGQIKFPATQNPSADANTLDDYEEGTWTVGLSFATPGNLSLGAYSERTGTYTKQGDSVRLFCDAQVVMTFTTASGNLEASGLPFVGANVSGLTQPGSFLFSNITKAGYTQFSPTISANDGTMRFQASGSGSALAQVVAADISSGAATTVRATVVYQTT